jgi:hypothetical protein
MRERKIAAAQMHLKVVENANPTRQAAVLVRGEPLFLKHSQKLKQ